MSLVAYKGRYAAVEVPGVGRVERDKPVEVDDKTAAQLVRQGWRKVSKPKNDDKAGK